MNSKAIDETILIDTVNSLKSFGFWEQSSIIDLIYRVLLTKKELHDSDVDPETVYKTMQDVSSAISRFPGDSELFYKIYSIIEPLDKRHILSIIVMSSDGKSLFVPEALSDKFAEYIGKDTKQVLITDCEQYGPPLLDLTESHPEVNFTLTSQQSVKANLLSLIFSNVANVKVILADIYSYGFTSEKYDLIISIPIFGARLLSDKDDFISREFDLIAVQNLLYHVNMDGNLVMVLPAKITFGGGSVASLREYIENNYKIKEISPLPSGLFAPYTYIRTYLFIFSTGKTDDIVIKQYESEKPIQKNAPCKKLVVKNEILLFNDEFSELSGWNVDMAFSEEDEDIKAFSASRVKKLKLKDVASVFRGKAVTARLESGNVSVINISNITDTGIDYSNLDMIEEEKRNVSRYILNEGDVLVTARGTTVKIAVFEQQSTICIPSANINVIRPREMLRGAYLKLFLESPVGIKMLQSLQRGTVVVNINYKDIMELEVPVLPIEVQDELIEEYNTGLKLYKGTVAAAEEGWRGVKQDIQSKLF